MMAANDDTLQSHVRALIRRHLGEQRRALPVSIATVSKLARAEMPGLALSDLKLSEIIGAEAVSAGHSVHFDNRNPWPEFRLDLPG